MALSSVRVHRVEGDATRLHGPFTCGTCGADNNKIREPREVLPTMDSSAADVDRHSKTIQLWDLDRCVAVYLFSPWSIIIGCSRRELPMPP